MNLTELLNGPLGLLIALLGMAFIMIIFVGALHLLSPKGYGRSERIVRELPPKEGWKMLRLRDGGKFTNFTDDVPYTVKNEATGTYTADQPPTKKNKSGVYAYYNREDAIEGIEGAKNLIRRGVINNFAVVKFHPRGKTICYEEMFRCEEAEHVQMQEYYDGDRVY